MKVKMRVAAFVMSCLFGVTLFGCASVKEISRGFAGVSTQVLEEARQDALKQSFALDLDSCYTQVKDVLSQKDRESYIYAQDAQKKLIAVYFSPTDTTPVGIFFTQEPAGSTLIEISSPSIYAKEEIANRVFTAINKSIKPKLQEKVSNVKEESTN